MDDDVDFTAARRLLRRFCGYHTPETLLVTADGTAPGVDDDTGARATDGARPLGRAALAD